MFRRIALFCCCIALFSRPQSQRHQFIPPYLESYQEAEKLYNNEAANAVTDSLSLRQYGKAIAFLENEPINDTVLFNSYVHASILHTSAGDDEQSLRLLQRSIRLNQASSAIPDSASFLPWLFAGSNYYSLYNSDSALACYREAEKIYQQHPGIPEAERLFNKMGVLYYEAGDFRKSIPQFSHALAVVDTNRKASDYFVVNYKNNIASAYRKLLEYNRALDIYRSLLPLKLYQDELRHNIGVTYLETGNAVEAIKHLRQVGYRNATIYNDLAKAYILDSKADSATALLELAYKTYAPNLVQDRPDHATSLKISGDLQSLNQNYAEAIRYYHYAILEIYPSFTDSTISNNPTTFNGTYNFYFLFDALTSKAKNYQRLYETNGNRTNLQYAFSTYEAATFLASHMERLYGTDESRLFVKRRAERVYGDAVEAGMILASSGNDKSIEKRLFAIMENSKASVLQADVYNLALNNVKGMPVKLLSEERAHRSMLSTLQQKLAQAGDSITIIALRSQIQNVSIDLTHVQEQLDQSTAYQSLRFGNEHPDPALLREQFVKGNQIILSYYVTGKYLLCYYIGNKENGYTITKIDSSFAASIRALRDQLVAPDGGNPGIFKSLSSTLSNLLLKPVSARIQLPDHLVIIPHKEISYVPFEMLADGNGQPMVKSHAISYQYSTNFIRNETKIKNSYTVLSIAPFASSGTAGHLPALPASGEEIAGLPGRSLIDSMATKEAFEKWVSDYPVLHLATHARADDSVPANSFISFYGEDADAARIYEPGIYQLDLSKTRLAILSACETGTGRLENSEGIISLSRAFTYAGCHSVITSLWKANDQATAFISKRLHHYLENGNDIDDALQKAKTDYLNSDDIDARYKKPSYWATLVLTGNPEAIVQRWNRWLIISIIGLALIGVSWMLLKNRSRGTKKKGPVSGALS